MRKILTIFFFLMIYQTFFAQSGSITGKVVDENNDPLPGANVMVVSTGLGAATNSDGFFTIRNVPTGVYSIRAQFVGYKAVTIDNVEVKANKSIEVNFNLSSGIIVGQEIVVVGYGVQQKRELTGSVTSVSTDEIKKIPTTQIGTALQGAAAGVNVSNATGAPGAAPRISIRGTATLGNNDPLYIVDGVPTDITYVNPSDIQSMDILKDASMSAIYGSRAANGVIIINTNRGSTKKGQEVNIRYNSYFASQSIENEFPFIKDKEQYVKIARMALDNAGIDYKTEFDSDYFLNRYDSDPSQFSSSDWENAYFNNAFEHKHDLSVSGGTQNFNYAVMGMYSNMDGIVKTTKNERMSLRLNSDLKKGIFKIGESVSVGRSEGSGRFNNLYSFYALSRMSPLTPIYANTESGYGSQMNISGLENQQTNPILENELNKNTWDEVKIMLSGYLEVDLLKDLKYTFRLSQNISDGYWFNFRPTYYTNEAENNQTASMRELRNRKYHSILESFLNYSKSFGDHSVTAMVGYAQESADGRSTSGYVQEFPNNDLRVLGAGESGDDASGWANEWRLRSYFGRVSYAYLDRYLLTANIRRDGSSRFDADNRWGNFPSFSGGWRISNEPFFDISAITDLKLRIGYGELGLQEFGDYQYIPKIEKDENGLLNYSYGPGRDQVIYIGARSLSFPSVGIQWETSKETNIGFDLSMFDDRFTMALDYYLKTSEGILFGVPIPKSAGAVSNPIVNSASIDNNGLELALNYKNFDSEFKYQIGATLSTYSNEVTKMGEFGDESIWGGEVHWGLDLTTKTVVGQPVASFFLYETNGLDGNGDLVYVDQNNDGEINEDDKVFMGNSAPDADLGLTFNASYSDFDFTINIFSSLGRKLINGGRWLTMNTDRFHAMHEDMLDAWTPSNSDSDIPRVIYGDARNARASDYWLEDASYLRIKYLELGYTIPRSLTESMGIGGIRFYIAAENLITFTGYSGYDPSVESYETGSVFDPSVTSVENTSGFIFDRGADRSPYPLARKFLTGIQVSL